MTAPGAFCPLIKVPAEVARPNQTRHSRLLGLHEVSREADGRVYQRAWDEFDRHSVILRPADTPGMDFVGLKVANESELDAFGERIVAAGRATLSLRRRLDRDRFEGAEALGPPQRRRA